METFKAYLEKSGLLYFYESLDSVFFLLNFNNYSVIYSNSVAKNILNIYEGNSIEEMQGVAKNGLLQKLRLVTSGEIENFYFKIYLPKSFGKIILRFQKIVIGQNQAIVVFSSKNDKLLQEDSKEISVVKNHLEILYKISKLSNEIDTNEELALNEIIKIIGKIFNDDEVWVRFKKGEKSYATENYNGENRMVIKKINLLNKANAYLEFGLSRKKNDRGGITFSLETEKILDEIIERLEDALNKKALKERIEKDKKRFRSIFEHANDAIILLNNELLISDFNKISGYIFGLTEEDLGKKKIFEVIPILTSEKIVEINGISKTLTDESFKREIIRHINLLTNNEMFLELNISSWSLDNRKYYTLFFSDVTQRVNYEKKIIYRSEFEKLIARISARFIESDFEKIERNIEFALKTLGEFLDADRGCIFVINYDNKTINCQYEWAKGERLINNFQKMNLNRFSELLNMLTIEQVVSVSKKNGNKQFLSFLRFRKIKSALAIALYSDNKFTGFIGFEFINKNFNLDFEDVSLLELFGKIIDSEISHFHLENERLEYENQLRKMKEVIEQSPLAIIITDYDGRIEYVNPRFYEITGYDLNEVIGKKPGILKSGFTSTDEYKKLWETIKAGKQWKGVFKNKKKNGEIFWESTIIIPVKNSEGKITNFLAMKEDITEQIKMKNELDLARKMEAIGQLAAGIAHEINSPMQFINDNIDFIDNTFSDILKYLNEIEEGVIKFIPKNRLNEINKLIEEEKFKYDIEFLREEIPEAIKQTKEGIDRVTKIIKIMKEYSHPHNQKKEPVNIIKAINDTIFLTRNTWKYVAEIKTELCEEQQLVNCNIDLINQALINIIVNAAQAIEEKIGNNPDEKGEIKIETECDEKYITIKISDNGIGISEENLDKIFDPFFTTKEVGKGTGQGLALVHDIIVKKHNGSIYVESQKGEGTTFTIKLPINNGNK